MMKNVFIIILLSISVKAFAEEAAQGVVPAAKPNEELVETRKSNYQLTNRYKGGPYLVYDCQGEFYACVDVDGSEKCREKRDESINKKETRLPCAPLKKFEDKKTCLQKNYEVLESIAVKRFCFPK
jgi:hypothetical protein